VTSPALTHARLAPPASAGRLEFSRAFAPMPRLLFVLRVSVAGFVAAGVWAFFRR